MKRAATRALLLCLIALILSTLLLAGAPPTVQAVNTYQSKIIDTFGDDIIAYWPLNEVSGTTAEDVSGNGFNGTYYGVTLDQADGAGDTFGRAGLWDGINDRIVVADNEALRPPEFTFTFWVWKTAGASYRFVLAKPAANWLQGYGFYYQDTFSRGWITEYYNGRMDATKWADQWEHWAVTYDGTTGRLYRNGVYVTNRVIAVTHSLNPLTIGCAGVNYCLDGNIQHVLIADRAFAADEVAVIANTEPLPEPTPTPTVTPLPLSHVMTLESGQPVRLDYSATAGDMLIGTLLLVFVGLLAFLVYLGLAKR